MDVGSILGITGIVLFGGCVLANWDNRKREERILKEAREAGDAYRDARVIREEAYRVLMLAIRLQKHREAGFEAGRKACVSKLQEISKYYASRPEAQGVAGHIDEMVTLLEKMPSDVATRGWGR